MRRRRQNAWKKAEAGLPEPEFAVADGFVATIQRTALATQAAGRRESQPESQPESLEGKVLSLLAAGQPMSRLEFSRKLGQKKISGQLNKIIRLLMRERSIEYTLPDKPQSRFQKYRLTDKDRAAASRPWARGMSGDEPWRRTENSDAAAPGRIDNQVLRDMLFH